MGMIDFALQFRPTVGYDQLLDRSVAANDVASPFSMSEGHLGKAERHVDFRCPDERAGLWTQWMQECLETFEAGAQWWGNAGPDRHLLATLDLLANPRRWDRNEKPDEPAQGVASVEEAMLPPVPANANVSQVSGSRFSGEIRVA